MILSLFSHESPSLRQGNLLSQLFRLKGKVVKNLPFKLILLLFGGFPVNIIFANPVPVTGIYIVQALTQRHDFIAQHPPIYVMNKASFFMNLGLGIMSELI